ncbi:MAG: GNAT family N-acetyltransferase [Ktedonobacteraceae bacterium]|nr:GNAT family N-acetyltransferase [Ktedonobacteraceae bacterium]
MANIEMKIEGLPTGFTLRRPTMDDLAAVKQLVNLCEVAEYGKAETTEDDMRLWWQRPNFDLATDAWLVFAPDGQVVADANVGHQQHVRIYAEVDVHPAYQHRGIGTHLLRLAEERAREHVPSAPDGARVVLISRMNSVNEAGQQLLEKHGFTLIRNFWRMGIELQETPPIAQWAEGLSVRTLAPGMERVVYEADEEIFQDHWGFISATFEQWSHWSLKGEHFDPSLWFLAMEGEEIAAIALCADEKESGGWVHVLGVRRPWRRKGVGLALLHHAFGEFYRRNIHNVYLGVDAQSLTGATRLYERAGMHVVRQSKNYEKELRAGKELSTQSVAV